MGNGTPHSTGRAGLAVAFLFVPANFLCSGLTRISTSPLRMSSRASASRACEMSATRGTLRFVSAGGATLAPTGEGACRHVIRCQAKMSRQGPSAQAGGVQGCGSSLTLGFCGCYTEFQPPGTAPLEGISCEQKSGISLNKTDSQSPPRKPSPGRWNTARF